MEANYWHQRWQQGEIGFHGSQVNPALVEHLSRLNLTEGARLFLPLCGKTLDIAWLFEHSYRIVGAELSSIAINELFAALGLVPEITPVGALSRYSAKNIDIWVGDIFDLTSSMLGAVDAIYDRAALVALPEHMRNRYTAHLIALTHAAPQLLITYEYDQHLYDGTPFSVPEKELKQYYGGTYQLQQMAQDQIAGGLKGKVEAATVIWLLQREKT
ncbi:thiopurine S-methyltransferase [Nitrosomonas communis]|uniref:Thiopurine S-methyltransferase n=1 Tax=Nitrosomonas communis TaxID=44574 RepID=A0A1H2TBH7_9PROT|nr:thiopurine S-methyltransferase [Nitrosomonas communis]SDW41296.1 thiopurine S-methyltransferase [Nitrosomonas communis]